MTSNMNNKLIALIDKCSYFVNNNTMTKCLLDKEYMYHKCCNISKQACYCIQNKLFYNNTVDNIKYYFIILFMAIVILSFYCTCKKIYTNIHMLENNHTHNSTNNYPNYDNYDNYYIIDKNDNLPKYNEIDNEINVEILNEETNKNKSIIVEIPPPKYIEID